MNSTTGLPMPKILYGTAWKKERTDSLVEQAIAAGFRGVDTACQPKHYNEAGVGDGIVSAVAKNNLDRESLYLQTKFTPLNGQDPLRLPYDANASLAEQVAQSFQTSLTNLQTTYLDCLILHSPLAQSQQTLEVWQAMETIFHCGKVKLLGISNCYDLNQFKNLYESAEIKPAVIQNRFYKETGYDRSIRQFCEQRQITYQSFWTLTANPGVLASSLIHKLSRTYEKSPEQVFYRYLTQIGIVPLTGTTSTTHMRDDLDIFSFELTEKERDMVDVLL